jgi:hypothetical protein
MRSIEKKIHLIGTRTRDLPACSIVPQPTTLPRAPRNYDLQRFNYLCGTIKHTLLKTLCLPPAFMLGCCLVYYFDPEDGGDMLLRNVGLLPMDCTALHPQRQNCSWPPLRELQILQINTHSPGKLNATQSSNSTSSGRTASVIWQWMLDLSDPLKWDSWDSGRL